MEANESLAYLAGIIDGEGTISVAVFHGKSGHSHNSIFVKVSNTCENVISYIDALMPGSISVSVRPSPRQPLHTIQWGGESAVDVIDLVLPYLIIKRSVAELALEMWYRCFANRYRRSVLTEAEIILRTEYVKRIRYMNRRGADKLDALRIRGGL